MNKKQKAVALKYALNKKADNEGLFVMDSIKIESGKTKDAIAFLNQINKRDYLVVVDTLDEKTFLAFRNVRNAYVIEVDELNAYDASTFYAIVMEKSAFEKVIKG
jgi:large subunit ribosomal protein L4